MNSKPVGAPARDGYLSAHHLVQRTEVGEDLLDATNLLAGVAEAVEIGSAQVPPRLLRAVLQQAAAVLDASAAHLGTPTAQECLSQTAGQLRSSVRDIEQRVG